MKRDNESGLSTIGTNVLTSKISVTKVGANDVFQFASFPYISKWKLLFSVAL